MLKKHFLFNMLFLCLTLGVFAQATEDKELTVEELYLSNPEIIILREQADSPDRETKILALDGIEKMVTDDTVTPEIENILIGLGSEGTSNKIYEGRLQINNFPEIRRRSCELLGKLGGKRAVSSLMSILKSEVEPMVMAEAAYALGTIGIDDDGEVVKALSIKIEEQTVVNPDSNFAYAVILAFQKIAEKNSGLKSSAGYRALIRIAQGNYIRGVKKMALDTLKDFKKYSSGN